MSLHVSAILCTRYAIPNKQITEEYQGCANQADGQASNAWSFCDRTYGTKGKRCSQISLHMGSQAVSNHLVSVFQTLIHRYIQSAEPYACSQYDADIAAMLATDCGVNAPSVSRVVLGSTYNQRDHRSA